jgi:hypothetical protein
MFGMLTCLVIRVLPNDHHPPNFDTGLPWQNSDWSWLVGLCISWCIPLAQLVGTYLLNSYSKTLPRDFCTLCTILGTCYVVYSIAVIFTRDKRDWKKIEWKTVRTVCSRVTGVLRAYYLVFTASGVVSGALLWASPMLPTSLFAQLPKFIWSVWLIKTLTAVATGLTDSYVYKAFGVFCVLATFFRKLYKMTRDPQLHIKTFWYREVLHDLCILVRLYSIHVFIVWVTCVWLGAVLQSIPYTLAATNLSSRLCEWVVSGVVGVLSLPGPSAEESRLQSSGDVYNVFIRKLFYHTSFSSVQPPVSLEFDQPLRVDHYAVAIMLLFMGLLQDVWTNRGVGRYTVGVVWEGKSVLAVQRAMQESYRDKTPDCFKKKEPQSPGVVRGSMLSETFKFTQQPRLDRPEFRTCL